MNYSQFLGYTRKCPGAPLSIVPGEADTVRRIYRLFLDGYTVGGIANQLTSERIPTPTGLDRWLGQTVKSILQNEKYCGRLLMQKWFTEDFLTHRQVKNTGQRKQYFLPRAHDPIVPEAVFESVQAELLRRGPGGGRFSERLGLNGRLFCGRCGTPMKRVIAGRGKREASWRRERRSQIKVGEEGRCSCRIVKEREVQEAVVAAIAPEMKECCLPPVAKRGIAACKDESDFYERTRFVFPAGQVGYSDEFVIRFVEKVMVTDVGIEVRFKPSPVDLSSEA